MFARGQTSDNDMQKEFMIQREFLEKTISALQSTLCKNKEAKKVDGMKIMEVCRFICLNSSSSIDSPFSCRRMLYWWKN